MNLPAKDKFFRVTKLTRLRIFSALAVAIAADGLQLALGPLGWEFGNQIIDVLAMLLTNWLLGFHWLLLPTFAFELVPLADDLPTWTACVIAVITLRKRQQRHLQSQMMGRDSVEPQFD